MITPSDRDELHPLCLARGIAATEQTGGGMEVSGHDYEQVSGDVLRCKVCGWFSAPNYEGYEYEQTRSNQLQ